MRFRTLLAAAVLVLLATSSPSSAQTATGTLFVEVQAPTGEPLSGAVVRLTNASTGLERIVTTGGAGDTVAPLLPAGEYAVTVDLDGFRPERVPAVRLEPGGKRLLSVTLSPRGFEESVVVSADATAARTASATISDVFDSRALVMTPLRDRDFMQLVQQAPGAVPPAPGSRLSTQANAGVNVSGARETANNFLLDGTDNNDSFLNRVVVTPSLDAVQEFTVIQNTYDAEYGRSAGAQINLVLKSGGSRAHGTAFEYFRDEALDARGVFEATDEPKAELSRHQFGGTMGGPVGRWPAFYFVSAEGLRGRSGETRLAHVPTPAERSGDFSGSGITISDPFTGQPFEGNRIPADRLDPAGVRLAAWYPDPNRGASDVNFASSPEASRDGVQLTAKLDHHGWRRHPITVRYSLTADDRTEPFPARGRNVPGFGTSVLDVGHNASVGLSQRFGDRWFNEARVGWNRLRRENIALNRGRDLFADLGIVGPSLPEVDQGAPAFTLAGYETLGDDPNLPVKRLAQTFHVSDAVTIERGRHQIKAGGEFRHYRSDGFNHLFARGQVAFTGAFTGDALGDLLLGLPTFSLIAANDNPQALRTTSWNAFVQHDWRPGPSLTLNAGLRYELNTPPVDASDGMRIFDLAARALRPVGEDGVPRSGVETDFNNFAPRLGAVWSLPGGSGLLLRAGFGVYYDAGTLIENSALYFNPPFFDLQTFFPAEELLTLRDPFPAGRGFRPLPSVNTLSTEFPTASTRQGSVGIEGRRLGLDFAARYVGARGRHLPRRRNINQPVPGAGPLDPRRPVADFADILLVEPAARSSYDALQIKVERQRAEGVSVRGAYTFGRSLDDASAFLQSDGNDNTPQNARDPDAEWGPSDYDVRHRLSLSALYAVPASVSSAWLRGWQVSALLTMQTGYPFTPRVGFDNSNTGNVGGSFGFDRPDEVLPSTAPAEAVFYDGRAFVVAPPFTFGSAGRNTLRGPGLATLDLAVVRAFQIGAARRLEARVELYNALNRTNLGLPDSFVDRQTFGQSLSARSPREVQLAVRFAF